MLIYDLEIKTPLLQPQLRYLQRNCPSLTEKELIKKWDDLGIDWAMDFHDFENIEIACLVICQLKQGEMDQWFVYCEDNLDEGCQLLETPGEVLAGFNNRRFDDQVIKAVTGADFSRIPHLDLLEEIWKALGLDPDDFDWKTHGGYGLGAMAEKNLGQGKTGHGAQAPLSWGQGKIGDVINYCMRNVWLTARLIRLVLQQGWLENPKDGECRINMEWRNHWR